MGTREMECPVCMAKEAKVVLQPCNHLATCNECHVRCQHIGRVTCPICRTPSTGSKQVDEMTAAGEDFYPLDTSDNRRRKLLQDATCGAEHLDTAIISRRP